MKGICIIRSDCLREFNWLFEDNASSFILHMYLPNVKLDIKYKLSNKKKRRKCVTETGGYPRYLGSKDSYVQIFVL